MPYLQDWNEKYAGDGFTIVGVHAPEFEFEKLTENVVEAAAELGVVWPIAQDNDFRTWRSYENRYWPAKYLVDANGIIRFTHFGEGAYDETEHHIRTLMEEAGHDVPDVTVGREEWKPILGTTVLRAGTQRVAFLLASGSALVRVPEATVTTTFLDGNAAGETATARFHEWPFGTRGSYVTRLTFPQAGTWRLDIEGDGGGATLDVQVDETSIVRDIGQIGIFSNTKTLDSAGGDIGSITSHYRPDPALYEITVAESLFSGRPSVVVFASPAFCTTATCGPQVETVTELREAYPDAADYIHVEVYDNPHEIQGDLTKGVLSPVLAEWGIDQVEHYRNESWTFILGADARIAERFEGYATFEELKEALQAALGSA